MAHGGEVAWPWCAALAQVQHQANHGLPRTTTRNWRRVVAEREERVCGGRHLPQHPRGGFWSDARQQQQHTKSRDAVARVLRPAQAREQVLDMCGLEKFQPAKLHEWNV